MLLGTNTIYENNIYRKYTDWWKVHWKNIYVANMIKQILAVQIVSQSDIYITMSPIERDLLE